MSEQSPLQEAQERLSKACLAQPMNPAGAAISAYVNSILCSARLDALIEVTLNPPNASWTKEEALDAAIVRHLNQKAEQLESQALQMQLAAGAQKPAIALPN